MAYYTQTTEQCFEYYGNTSIKNLLSAEVIHKVLRETRKE